ncbi:alpha-L-rhamnosidase-like isoform X2 [Oscarella lobularis]|uniref:alpha-L-rhamnosidase-like isoform X2 n=1 Tax=Oscarella lobularis TaxID=121494 RepID=UPI003313694D
MKVDRIFVVLFVAVSTSSGGPLPPTDLLSNNLPSSHGAAVVGVDKPTFSWLPRHTERTGNQTAYQVVVYASTQKSQDLQTPVLDSGKVYSSYFRSVEVGRSFVYRSYAVYSWKVRWWDENDEVSEYSEQSVIEAAMTNQDQWSDSLWIAAPNSIQGAPYLRSPEFSISNSSNSTVKRARIYASGLGFFRLYVNGKRIGDDALVPGWTNYNKRALYVAYDVTNYLSIDMNVVGAILGLGWRDRDVFTPHDEVPPGDTMASVFRMKLVIATHEDPETYYAPLTSGSNWTAAPSPITSSSIYNGETYDARLEKTGWNEVGYKPDNTWKAVMPVPGPTNVMSLQLMPSIKQQTPNEPIDIQPLEDKSQVVDFGKNLAGYCRLTVKGEAGTVVTLKHAEVKMHPPYGPMNGSLYFANLRSAKATDTYILKGDAQGETYEPYFTYHGFRYVQVFGYPGTIQAQDLLQIPIHTNVSVVKTLDTSSLIVNDIQASVQNGHLSNLMSVVTDCPQRDERLGWMGDAGLSSDAMALGFDMHAFYTNMLRNIRDEQGEDGSIPDVVPFYRYGSRPADPSWSAAFPQIVFVLFKYYGDLAAVRENYEALKLYFKNLEFQVPATGLSHMKGSYGDWCMLKPPNPVPPSFTSAFSYIQNLEEFAEMAQAIGEASDAEVYANLAAKLRQDFHESFYNVTHYSIEEITSYVLPLFLGIPTPQTELWQQVQVNFMNYLDPSDGFLSPRAGIIGTKFLLLQLSSGLGRTDVALQLAEQIQVPSWGHMLYNPNEPATAVWELWDGDTEGPGMNSRNHHMFSSVAWWIRMELGGVQPTSSFNDVLQIYVARTPGLSYVNSAEYRVTSGRIAYSWQRQGGIQCRTVPENQSPSNPTLPKHADLKLDCGDKGGVINSIDFADFGLPLGGCSNFGHRSSCTSSNATVAVGNLCLGKEGCTVPSGVDFWGDPCYGQMKQLSIQVTCSEPDSITASVETSVGILSEIYLPFYGLEVQLKE